MNSLADGTRKSAVTDLAEESTTEKAIISVKDHCSDPIPRYIHPNLVQNPYLTNAITLIRSLNQLTQSLASNSNLESLKA